MTKPSIMSENKNDGIEMLSQFLNTHSDSIREIIVKLEQVLDVKKFLLDVSRVHSFIHNTSFIVNAYSYSCRTISVTLPVASGNNLYQQRAVVDLHGNEHSITILCTLFVNTRHRIVTLKSLKMEDVLD